MQTMQTRMCIAFFGVLLAATATDGFATRKKADPSAYALNDQVYLLNLINAAESAYFQGQGRYADFAELVRSEQIQQSSQKMPEYAQVLVRLDLRDNSQPLAGFKLTLTVSPNPNGYYVLLTQQGACGAGWFTDQSGVVYGGRAITCGEGVNGDWAPLNVDAEVPAVRDRSQCPLTQILHETSARASELVQNLERFSATEEVNETEFGRNGKPHKSTKELYSYVAEIEKGQSGSFRVEEYRSGRTQEEGSPSLSDTGTAAFGLIFLPSVIGNFEVRCEGRTEYQGVAAWQLHFEERPGAVKSFHSIRIKNSRYLLRLKGRAWIAADSYEVLRIQTDLVAPVREINLQLEHLDITYGPVDFGTRQLQLWLPQRASMHISFQGHHYQRLHSFSRFQLFMVNSDQKVKEPVVHPSGG
jgi:hypothetical protein